MNGIKPTQFCGNPSEFPFFRKQVRDHLESSLLPDVQRVEYLPKFLSGEALEVVKRNRGCSYTDLIKTLENRYGRPIQVSQACIEELASGPKLVYGDNISLLNFAEQLNTATKVLTGNDEQEASVATNLKRIVNRLPNDLIFRWQNVNYDIVSRGSSARLADIAMFVKKQASIRNDPVFGMPKREIKDVMKNVLKTSKSQVSTYKQSTVAIASINKQPVTKRNDNCGVCKGSPHNIKHCPVIKQCELVNVRRQYAMAYRFCFNCGKQCPGHGSSTCPDAQACTRCHGRHLDILHKDFPPDYKATHENHYRGESSSGSHSRDTSRANNREEDKKVAPKPHSSEGSQVPVSSAAADTINTNVMLNVLPVIITADNNNSVSTYAFLDNGCTDTLIDKELADQLGIIGTPEVIQVNTITASHQEMKTQRVRFTLSSVDDAGERIEVNHAYVLHDLNQSERILPDTIDASCHSHLQDIRFPDVDVRRVSIVLGSNVPSAHVQREVRFPPDDRNGIHGYRYPLGWSLCGPLVTGSQRKSSVNYVSLDRRLDEQIEQFWKIEDCGVVHEPRESLSEEDKRALKIIEETCDLVDGHYEVGLLWRDDQRRLPDNRNLAERRLESLKRRLTKPENNELALKYREVMNDYIKKGYARQLTQEEVERESPIRCYLPHHPVTNPNKPGKVRIVFDAAAECEGTSLNKALLPGPDSTNNLVGVLLRFRQGNVALSADVEAMFHQVRVTKQDQEALRFLWWTNSLDEAPDVYTMQVHIFGAASSPCIANSTLRRTADDNAESFGPEVVSAVKGNFYVDDCLASTKDEASASRLASDLVDILHQGGFRLTKFMSSSKRVLSEIPCQRRAKPELNLDLDKLPIERALGVRWFVETDEIGFDIKHLLRPETKRGILSTVCSLYDPLGLAAPVTLQARSLIQDLWRAKVEWDQPLGDNVTARWKKWKMNLNSLSEVRIPRSYFLPGTDLSQCSIQIHHFADASEIGYGTCSYLRTMYTDGTIHCAFIMGKSRNTPIKFTSIPRLELQAAVLATRMNKMIRGELELNIDKTTYWTDSEIVLHYLKNEKRRLQTYVANRVQEIKDNSLIEEWNHVPGVINPADDASRGLNPSDLFPNHRWLHGPEFLWEDESSWPHRDVAEVSDETLEVKRKTQVNSTDVAVASERSVDMLQRIINDCSDWTKLTRKFAWISRFIKFIQDRKHVDTGDLTVEEIENAAIIIARITQRSVYQKEIASLYSSGAVKPSSKIANLNPMLDSDQVMKVNGRVKNSPNCHVAAQIILPRHHHMSTLLVRHIHEHNGHLGREHVLAKLREKFWIPQGRVLIRSILRKCLVCRKLHSKPMTQQMAPLPKDRTTAFEPPFTYTGMDLFGPLHVKHGRGTAKRWCCLFTCLNTRCVHLELVNSMDTDAFIMCLRRFMNRRGEVKELRCDNGSNFVGGERELRESMEQWNQNQVQRELIQRGCKWIFQPPTASSMSGVWERLVRSAKTVLKSIIASHTVTDVTLTTVLTEVERILNGRALTANSDDPSDLEALTPSHFLLHRRVIALPPGVFDKADGILRKQWRQTQYLANLFWSRWIKEYLPTLQVRKKWLSIKQGLKPNDLVLLIDNNAPRGRWHLGRILETYPGPDGLVRTVKVKAKDSVYIRPIQKLCLLEDDVERKMNGK